MATREEGGRKARQEGGHVRELGDDDGAARSRSGSRAVAPDHAVASLEIQPSRAGTNHRTTQLTSCRTREQLALIFTGRLDGAAAASKHSYNYYIF